MELELIDASYRPALKTTSLRVQPGLTLLGGTDRACQAALMRLLALRWKPTQGMILVDGRDASTLGPADRASFARKVGFAPAGTSLPGHLRVRSALVHLATLWQVPGQARVEAELDRWDLTSLQDESLGRLSPGERRRFVLAASLVMSPVLWLLEHPFQGLDLPGRNLLRHLLISTAHGGDSPQYVVLAHDGYRLDFKDLLVRTSLSADKGHVSHDDF